MTPLEMIKQLQKEFVREYPGFGKRVGMKHVCAFFGITRQSLYQHKNDTKSGTKLNTIDRSKRSNEKFLKFLFNNYKTSGKSDEN